MSVEEEGRQGKALKERQPGLRVHVHWHPSVSRSHAPSSTKEKYFPRLGEERTQQVEEAVDEVISYWQDRLRVRRRVARSQYDFQNICQKGSAGQAVQGPRGVVRQGVS